MHKLCTFFEKLNVTIGGTNDPLLGRLNAAGAVLESDEQDGDGNFFYLFIFSLLDRSICMM